MLQLVIPLHQQLHAARANLKCFVIIPDGQIAFGKLAQAIAYGAKIIQINGNFDDGMSLSKILLMNSQMFVLLIFKSF